MTRQLGKTKRSMFAAGLATVAVATGLIVAPAVANAAPATPNNQQMAVMPNELGANGHAVKNQLAALGFDNVNLVPANPALGPVVWQDAWRVVGTNPAAGANVPLTTPITVTMRR